MAEFCNLLTKCPEVDRFRPGALALFDLGIDAWPELRFRHARLRRLLDPD